MNKLKLKLRDPIIWRSTMSVVERLNQANERIKRQEEMMMNSPDDPYWSESLKYWHKEARNARISLRVRNGLINPFVYDEYSQRLDGIDPRPPFECVICYEMCEAEVRFRFGCGHGEICTFCLKKMDSILSKNDRYQEHRAKYIETGSGWANVEGRRFRMYDKLYVRSDWDEYGNYKYSKKVKCPICRYEHVFDREHMTMSWK